MMHDGLEEQAAYLRAVLRGHLILDHLAVIYVHMILLLR